MGLRKEINNIKRDVIETCPHCDNENNFEWDVDANGYIAECTECKRKIFLCDECLNSEDNEERKCDWHLEGNCGVCFRGRINNEI